MGLASRTGGPACTDHLHLDVAFGGFHGRWSALLALTQFRHDVLSGLGVRLADLIHLLLLEILHVVPFPIIGELVREFLVTPRSMSFFLVALLTTISSPSSDSGST